MTLLDIFKKKKKTTEKKKEPAEVESKPLASQPAGRVLGAKAARPTRLVTRSGRAGGQAWRVLKEPHVSEKATDLTAKNQYVFKIYQKANKIEVRKAVENLYNVNVREVKIIRVPAKKRRLARIEGQRKGYKKAIVKLKEGQKIEVLPR